MEDNNFSFSRSDTKVIKGIAIFLMLLHHLWGFPDRIYGGGLFHFISDSWFSKIADFGKICVPIFFFLGGYGIYEQSKNGNLNILKNIKKLYVSFWKVFLIFIPIGYIFFSNQIPYTANSFYNSAFSNFNIYIVFNNFLGFTSLNTEWWFFFSYLCAIISFPFLKKIFKSNNVVSDFFLVVFLSLLNSNVLPALGRVEVLGYLGNNFIYTKFFCNAIPYISSFWVGMLFSKHDLFPKLDKKINEVLRFNIFHALCLIFLYLYLREFIFGNLCDVFFVPFFIYACLYILKNYKFINKIFYKIGKQSTNMWLSHSFLCYYFYPFARIVVAPSWAVSSLLLFILLSYVVSLGVDSFWKKISDLLSCFKNKLGW